MTFHFTGGCECNGLKILFAKVLERGVTNAVAVLKFNLEVGNIALVFDFIVTVRSFHSFDSLVNVLTH